ncbi:MAG: ribose-5-phosphate isomerase RpiA [Candidatus Melainabacteria bacterium]|nr:ribose-5-phosphate isomerase RpiA [Candidatus Melainabacteria bacterium]
MSKEAIKKAVGYQAAELIESGMRVGLGTGTTAHYFIERLGERCRAGLKIHAVASSQASRDLAEKGQIPLLEMEKVTSLDLTVDGADEIDPEKRMIKGGGGALVREKILASISHEMVVIVDETKLVPSLGKHKLPVEIVPFASHATAHNIKKAGYSGTFRKNKDGSLFHSDNNNLILDIHFESLREDPEADHEVLIHIPGVVDTGFFFHLAGRVIVGFADGQVVIKP